MKRLAVIGSPVAHSLSPQLHGFWAGAIGMPLSYLRVRVERVERILPLAELLDLDGFNLTAPWKEAIVPFLDGLDDRCARIGAVNTVLRSRGGWIGYNSDPEGVVGALSARKRVFVRGETALVVGAGGAAAAAGLALKGMGFRVFLTNRSPDRGRRLAASLALSFCPWGEMKSLCASVRVAVVAAPIEDAVGLLRCFPAGALILEADYRRGRLVKCRGDFPSLSLIGGEAWLLHQAAEAFRLFTGVRLEAEDQCRAAKQMGNGGRGFGSRHLLLLGLPGSGKSTVASKLAVLSRRQYRDLDAWVVRMGKRPLEELFSRFGEGHFRQLESASLRQILTGSPAIISLGGGVVEKPQNRRLLAEQSGTAWLAVPPSVALERVKGQGGRPLLAGRNAAAAMTGLFERRKGHYAALAQLVVDGTMAADRIAEGLHEEMVCL